MIINHNISALVTNNALQRANANTDKSSKKLSTGLRINSAADDAAGLAISNKMKTQVRGLAMADRNCNDAVSLIQTAEGGLSEVQNMLQRMRELAVQGANDTLTDSDRAKIQDECDELIDEINDTASKIQFNTKSLLDGSEGMFTFQVGPNAGLTLTVDMEEITSYKIGAITDENGTFTSLSQLKSQPSSSVKIGIETNVNSVETATGTEERVSYADYDETAGKVTVTTYAKGATSMPETSEITSTGTYMVRSVSVSDGSGGTTTATKMFDAAGNDVTSKFVEYSIPGDSTSTNIGFDITEYTAPCMITVTSSTNDAGATIYKESVTALTVATVDAETLPENPATYTLSTDDSDDIQYTMTEDGNKMIITDTAGTGGFMTVESCAYTALAVCDGAINDVSEFRSRLGAVQNRLEYTSSALGTSSENAETALSRVQDTDMASEMTEYTKNNVIVQAGISMLAQANQRPNQLLSLLQ